jgi:hypothetical protein
MRDGPLVAAPFRFRQALTAADDEALFEMPA